MKSEWVELSKDSEEHLNGMSGKKRKSEEPEGESVTFGRLVRDCLTVDFVLRSGKRYPCPYHLISWGEYEDAGSFDVWHADFIIKVRGRNLERAHRYLGDHRVREIRETDRPEMQPDDAEVVESISVSPRK